MFSCSEKLFVSDKNLVSVHENSLKHGFQWLRQQNTSFAINAIDVDENTNTSFLEHLVFGYNLLAVYFQFFE